MRAKIFEKYYKQGFNHMLFKQVMGLKKPDKNVKRLYYGLIVLVIVLALVIGSF